MWLFLIWIGIAGATGGLINSYMADEGFSLPDTTKVDGISIFRPGWIGNVAVGAVAATVSWALYGPLASFYIAGTPEALHHNSAPESVGLSLSSLAGAVLVGIGGARWLSNEVDKRVLRATASKAAGAKGSREAAQQIALADPSEALKIAMKLETDQPAH